MSPYDPAADPNRVSPKVLVPAVGQLLVAIALAIITGEVNGPEIAAAVSAVITLALGYSATDPARAPAD